MTPTMTLMIPLGFDPHFSTSEQLVLVGIGLVLATVAALPASLALGVVGHARGRSAGQPGGWNGTWYWLQGTALTWATMLAGAVLGLDWFAVPVGWLPGLTIAALLHRRRGPSPELGWRPGHRPVGER